MRAFDGRVLTIEADKRAAAPPAKDCAKDPTDPRNH